ncbi:MAG: prevent-host-death protein [Betaproteobacteria bacterium RIFCSPLOWO2_12_FULL_62_58]|nr:MAG: prevent-host-death protein [Betaproteobacteria bacterium RIFCSPLOWO2_12_FULL_62_58]
MSTTKWQLQQAKNRLSEVVRRAQREGPQVITLHGSDAAVVVSAKDYGNLSRPKGKLVDFFRKSPLVGVDLALTRSKDTGREIDL